MQLTPNLGLKKPEGTDVVDIANLNDNADVLDSAIAGKAPLASPTFTGTVTAANLTASGAITSTRATGNAPLVVASTTKVTNLNADKLDGYDASTTAAAGTVPVYNASAQLVGDVTGNAATATKLATARTLSLTGDGTASISFDGSAAASGALTLSASGVSAGTYKSVTVDAKGRVTGGTNPTTLSGYGITDAAPSSHVSDLTSHVPYAAATGSANTYAVTLSPAPSSLTAGLALAAQISTANTGASTINVNGLGAKSILTSKGAALTSGKLVAGGVYTLRYNGTAFILQGEGGEYGTAAAAQVLSGYTVGTEAGVVAGSMVNRSGETSALSSSISGTTLRLLASQGYRNGASDYVTISDNNFLSANIRKNISVLGLMGTYSPTVENLGFDTPLWRVRRTSFNWIANSIAVDDNGNSYLAQNGASTIQKFDRYGNFVQAINVGGVIEKLLTYVNYLFVMADTKLYRYDINNLSTAPIYYDFGVSTFASKLSVRGGTVYTYQGIYPLTVVRLSLDLLLMGTWTPLNGSNVYTVLFDDYNVAYIGVNTGTTTNIWYKGTFGGTVVSIGSMDGPLYAPTKADVNSNGTRLIYGKQCYDASGSSLSQIWPSNLASMLPSPTGTGLIKYVGNNEFIISGDDATVGTTPYPSGFAKINAGGSSPAYTYKAHINETAAITVCDYNPTAGIWTYSKEYKILSGYEKF
ncbi:hypothetical protein [Cohnella fermenti]|uniref:hypothetical protein n=1 Tax=Cohnella fermenti TaxID=2565925 RepID=UPI001B3B29B3|nr:hypothetical protein [Cohnella fermenti]